MHQHTIIMVILSKTIINEFITREPRATDALLQWYRLTKAAEWSKFQDIKKIFNSVDAVGNDRFVFNIKGNNYRLVAVIHFDIRTVYIVFLGNHSEYDKIDASIIKFKN